MVFLYKDVNKNMQKFKKGQRHLRVKFITREYFYNNRYKMNDWILFHHGQSRVCKEGLYYVEATPHLFLINERLPP